MPGNNYTYRISMKIALEKKLKERAKEEGLSLAELIRKIFDEWLGKEKEKDILMRIEKKMDKILQKN